MLVIVGNYFIYLQIKVIVDLYGVFETCSYELYETSPGFSLVFFSDRFLQDLLRLSEQVKCVWYACPLAGTEASQYTMGIHFPSASLSLSWTQV